MSFTNSSDEKKSFSCYYRLKKYGICILALSLLVLSSAIVSAAAESLQFNEIGDQTVTAGDAVSFTVSAVGPAPDQIRYGVENMPSDASIDENTGEFSWTPSAGEHQLQFFATDGASTVTQFVTIYVIAPVNENNPPLFPPVDPQYVDENSFLTFTLPASDDDGDEITFSSSPLPAGAELDPSTGIFEWTPATGQAGTYDINFMVSDGALSASATGKIIVNAPVNPVNNPPLLPPAGPYYVAENSPLMFTLGASDEDGDELTYSSSNLPVGADLNPGTGIFKWTPGKAGTYPIKFTVSDGTDSASTTAEVIVSAPVNPVNNPPLFPSAGPYYVAENSPLTFTLGASDEDGNKLTYSSSNLPEGADLDPNTGIFKWTPTTDQAGTYDINFMVSDGALSASTTAKITVSEVNSETGAAPVIATIAAKTVVVKNTLQFEVKASGGNDTLVFSATEMPSGATFNDTTHIFKWVPSTSQTGMHSVTFKVTDGESTDEETVSISVKEASDSSDDSTGGSASGGSSGGSGGSSQASSEEYENIEFKDYSIKYVLKDVDNVFSFKRENNSIQSVIIRTRLNQGETKSTVEMLKNTSSMAKKDAPGIVYRNLNIWVGDEKFSSSNLIEAKVEFMVEKAWLTENSVDPASIKLLRYSDSWGYVPTSIKGQDKTYVYYTAKVPEFSVFAISSVDESAFAEDGEGNQSNDDENISRSVDDSEGLNGTAPINPEKKSSWLILFVLVGMAGVGTVGYMYREKVSEMLFKLGNSDGKSYRRSKR